MTVQANVPRQPSRSFPRAVRQSILNRRDRILATVAEQQVMPELDPRHTRQQVLRSAVSLFAELGFDACTMRDLARAADVKPPALYNHFSSKEQILSEAMWLAVGDFFAFVLGPIDTEPSERLFEGIVRRHTIFQIENSATATANDLLVQTQSLSRHMADPGYSAFKKTGRDYFEIVRDLARWTAGRQSQGRLTIDTFAVIAACDRVSVWYRTDGRLSPEEVATQTWRLVQRITS